jgi:hypothetical protein
MLWPPLYSLTSLQCHSVTPLCHTVAPCLLGLSLLSLSSVACCYIMSDSSSDTDEIDAPSAEELQLIENAFDSHCHYHDAMQAFEAAFGRLPYSMCLIAIDPDDWKRVIRVCFDASQCASSTHSTTQPLLQTSLQIFNAIEPSLQHLGCIHGEPSHRQQQHRST